MQGEKTITQILLKKNCGYVDATAACVNDLRNRVKEFLPVFYMA